MSNPNMNRSAQSYRRGFLFTFLFGHSVWICNYDIISFGRKCFQHASSICLLYLISASYSDKMVKHFSETVIFNRYAEWRAKTWAHHLSFIVEIKRGSTQSGPVLYLFRFIRFFCVKRRAQLAQLLRQLKNNSFWREEKKKKMSFDRTDKGTETLVNHFYKFQFRKANKHLFHFD